MRTNAELYDQDFYAWTQDQAALLREGWMRWNNESARRGDASCFQSNRRLIRRPHQRRSPARRLCAPGFPAARLSGTAMLPGLLAAPHWRHSSHSEPYPKCPRHLLWPISGLALLG